MTPRQRRAMELANHLHLRARINESIRDGEPVDYAEIRACAPMLREAANLLLVMGRGGEPEPPDPEPTTNLRTL